MLEPVPACTLVTEESNLNLRISGDTLRNIQQQMHQWVLQSAKEVLEQQQLTFDVRTHIENEELLQVLQLQSQFLQQLRGYVDHQDHSLWEKICGVHNHSTQCSSLLSQVQDQHRGAIMSIIGDLKLVSQNLERLKAEYLSGLLDHVNYQMEELSVRIALVCKRLETLALDNKSGVEAVTIHNFQLATKVEGLELLCTQLLTKLDEDEKNKQKVTQVDSNVTDMLIAQMHALHQRIEAVNEQVDGVKLFQRSPSVEQKFKDLEQRMTHDFQQLCKMPEDNAEELQLAVAKVESIQEKLPILEKTLSLKFKQQHVRRDWTRRLLKEWSNLTKSSRH